MASMMASSIATGFDGGRSFYEQIMDLNSRHRRLMTEELNYMVYVDSPFVYHHRLVLVDKQEYREHVTIELTITDDDESWQVAPKARLYFGELESLKYKGKVYASLEHICEVAYRILVEMGSYDVAFNNCQHFCDKVLKELGLPGHTTDTTKVGVGAAILGVLGTMALTVYGVSKYFSTDDQDTQGKGRRKNF